MLRPSPTPVIGPTVASLYGAGMLMRCSADGDELLECMPFPSSPSESESSSVINFFVRRRRSRMRGDKGGVD